MKKKNNRAGVAFAVATLLTAGTIVLSSQAHADEGISGAQLKSDLNSILDKSFDTNVSSDSAFNNIVLKLKSQLSEAQDWEYEELAPLIGQEVNQLSQLSFYPIKSPKSLKFQARSITSFGGLDFPDASYPDAVTWSFGIGSGDGEPTGDPVDESEGGECSGSVRNTPRAIFDLQMGAIITEGIARVADSFCEQVVVAVGGGNLSIACIITEIADVVVQGVLDANLLCDDIKDSVEIEASYNRLEHIHDDLDTVDTGLTTINTSINSVNASINNVYDLVQDVNDDLSDHDSDVKEVLNGHDSEVKEAINDHDTEIKTILLQNQTVILNKLAALQLTANSNSAILLEVVRLLHTPNGKRTSEIQACAGDACDWNY